MGDLGWGGVGLGSWGWAFSFLCFGIVECAHGHAYAKQVRIMCVLSVPLLDQVQAIWTHFGGQKCVKHQCFLAIFRKNTKNHLPREGKKASVFDVFGLKHAISS